MNKYKLFLFLVLSTTSIVACGGGNNQEPENTDPLKSEAEFYNSLDEEGKKKWRANHGNKAPMTDKEFYNSLDEEGKKKWRANHGNKAPH